VSPRRTNKPSGEPSTVTVAVLSDLVGNVIEKDLNLEAWKE
jgi:hypothetical protein